MVETIESNPRSIILKDRGQSYTAISDNHSIEDMRLYAMVKLCGLTGRKFDVDGELLPIDGLE